MAHGGHAHAHSHSAGPDTFVGRFRLELGNVLFAVSVVQLARVRRG